MEPISVFESRLLCYLVLSLFSYTTCAVIWRLWISPCSKFPGPKLAALTSWYEFYYNGVRDGQFNFKIRELHQKYGPIVRISPEEVHIEDPDFIDQLYVSQSIRKSDRHQIVAEALTPSASLLGTADHDLYRVRRAAISSSYSRGAVLRYEPHIQQYVQILLERLKDHKAKKIPVSIEAAFSAMTHDVMGHSVFGWSGHRLKSDGFKDSAYDQICSVLRFSAYFRQFGWLMPIMRAIPAEATAKMMSFNPRISKIVSQLTDIRDHISHTMHNGKHPDRSRRMTTLDSMVASKTLPPQEKTVENLAELTDELLSAGTFTTARSLATLTFHLLDKPHLLKPLKEELAQLYMTNPHPTFLELEKLPYLSAVVKEGLRCALSLAVRSVRKFREPLQYKEWTIPAGVAVGMNQGNVLSNPQIYPEPEEFRPERWMGPAETRPDKYHVVFGRGSRRCPGQELAYCEIYLTVAALFGPDGVDMQLFETDFSDVKLVSEHVLGFRKADSKGIRVLVE